MSDPGQGLPSSPQEQRVVRVIKELNDAIAAANERQYKWPKQAVTQLEANLLEALAAEPFVADDVLERLLGEDND